MYVCACVRVCVCAYLLIARFRLWISSSTTHLRVARVPKAELSGDVTDVTSVEGGEDTRFCGAVAICGPARVVQVVE